METARAFLAVAVWFALVTIGVRVDAGSTNADWFGFLVFVLSSTVTNVGLLAVCASLISGGDWLAAVRRGFTIYAMLISGTVVLFTDSISNPSPEQYAKVAGMVSLVCVLCSYRPELFDGFLDRLAIIFKGEQ